MEVYGDSGAWIVEEVSEDLCGHLVAGDPATGLAFVIPAKTSFDHIEEVLDCRIQLPGGFADRVYSMRSYPELLRSDSLGTTLQDPYGTGKGKTPASSQGPYIDFSTVGSLYSEEEPRVTGLPVSFSAAPPESISSEPWTAQSYPLTPGERAQESSQRMAIGRSSHPHRNRASATRQNDYFVPQDGIDREVITADIARYLGSDALVRPGTYEVYPSSLCILARMLIARFRTLKLDNLSKDTSSQLTGTLHQ
jgi:hypothetical protein